MKLNDAIEWGKLGRWQDVQVRISPGSPSQWFVMLRDVQHKSYILADNEDQPIATEDMNKLAQLIRAIGQKEFTAFL